MMILMEMILEVVIGVLFMEVDKVADEVTNMDVDKVTNMMAKITNEDFSNCYDMIFIEMMLELVMYTEVDKVADEVADMEVDMEVD